MLDNKYETHQVNHLDERTMVESYNKLNVIVSAVNRNLRKPSCGHSSGVLRLLLRSPRQQKRALTCLS